MSIAVVDDGGHPLALERLDGCAPIGAYIATERPARRPGTPGNEALRGHDQRRTQCLPLGAAAAGHPEGGVPILVDGQVVGAVGVSGVRAEEDARVARIGAEGL
ncbi:heme-binding protein [Pseudomonas aeruginosa]